MTSRAVVVGSGPGGAVAAMVLAEAGWDVTVFERGPQRVDELTGPTPATEFSNDELKARRGFEMPDPRSEPRTFDDRIGGPLLVGAVNPLPAVVGGGSVHWDGKVPRFWDLDFAKLSALGPVPDADVRDWPFGYDDLAPCYDELERLLGVQGDIALLGCGPAGTHAPRADRFPMRPGPGQYSSVLLADAASRRGLHPYPTPSAINSEPYGGRPACNDCGFCEGYGCVTHARSSALVLLERAVAAGARVVAEQTVTMVRWSGRRAVGVEVAGPRGEAQAVGADLVVLAAGAVETCRLALLSGLPDPHDQIGRFLMLHWFSTAMGTFTGERLHASRGRSHTHALDDFADPDFGGAREAARRAGLPYLRGGVAELGSSPLGPIGEADVYRRLLPALVPDRPFGRAFKELMAASPLRDRLTSIQMCGEDLAQAGNRVTLDPGLQDYLGVPVARVHYAPHRHELVAQEHYLPQLAAILTDAGAAAVTALAETRSTRYPAAPRRVPATSHALGGMRMGATPETSVTDGDGRVHALANVVVADGSVFPTSGGHNPTLTIMATALRNARAWA